MTMDQPKSGNDDSRHSPASRAARIFSALQGAMYITDPLSNLSSESRAALIDAIATVISQSAPEGIGGNIIQLIKDHVPGFAESWTRFEAEGGSKSRLLIVEVLARGEYL